MPTNLELQVQLGDGVDVLASLILRLDQLVKYRLILATDLRHDPHGDHPSRHSGRQQEAEHH